MSITIVQAVPVATGSSGDASATWPAATTAGNTLVAVLQNDNSRNPAAPSGWTKRAGSLSLAVFDYVNAPSQAAGSTVTGFGLVATNWSLWLYELSGVDNTAPADLASQITGTGGTATISGTTGGSARIAFSAVGGTGGALFHTVDTADGWAGSASSAAVSSYKTLASGGLTVSNTVTGTGAAPINWAASLVTYNAAGATTPLSASAGTDQQVKPGSTVTLSASGVAGTAPYTYAWTQTAGPAVTLSSTTAQSPTFTAPADVNSQSLTFQVTVTDSTSATATDTVNVSVSAGPYLYRRESGAWVRRKLYRRASGAWVWP